MGSTHYYTKTIRIAKIDKTKGTKITRLRILKLLHESGPNVSFPSREDETPPGVRSETRIGPKDRFKEEM